MRLMVFMMSMIRGIWRLSVVMRIYRNVLDFSWMLLMPPFVHGQNGQIALKLAARDEKLDREYVKMESLEFLRSAKEEFFLDQEFASKNLVHIWVVGHPGQDAASHAETESENGLEIAMAKLIQLVPEICRKLELVWLLNAHIFWNGLIGQIALKNVPQEKDTSCAVENVLEEISVTMVVLKILMNQFFVINKSHAHLGYLGRVGLLV